jgi:hypothetical protein
VRNKKFLEENIMKLNRALQILAKFFSVGEDVFYHSLSKTTIIDWAEQVKAQGDKYLLTQPQHAFLIGEILTF